MKRRAFLSWFMELMIWMAAVLIFGCLAIVFDIPAIFMISVIAALMMILRIKGMQYVYEYQQAMIKVLNEYGQDMVVILWMEYQRKAVITGNEDILLNGWVPMKDSMNREQLDTMIKKLTAHPEDAEEHVYKMSLIGEIKYLKLTTVEEYGMEAYIITDVTADIVNKAALLEYTYYDMKTKLLSRDAFTKRVEEALLRSDEYVCLMVLDVWGVDKAVSEQEERIDHCFELISLLIKDTEKEGAIAGRTSQSKFVVAFLNSNQVDALQRIAKLSDEIGNTIDSFNKLNNMKLTFGGGVCHYPNQANNFKSLLAKADFALFEARSQNEVPIMEYSEASFALREQEYIKIQEFNRLVNGNLFDYHYQPIVRAESGEIFAYEALMRPRSDILKTPPEVLHIAEMENRLDEIERLTLQNTIRILSENQDVFRNRKLFVNSIPNCRFPQEEFNVLQEKYGALFEKMVVEITEERDLDEETEGYIRDRYRANGSKIALDDYGSGYSNDSNLLKIQPDFVKIDRSLLIDIDKDSQKLHLVGNMIDFAKKHGIMVIVEGLEKESEIHTVIKLGADLIQGFYTSKPRAVFLMEISNEVQDKLKSLNQA